MAIRRLSERDFETLNDLRAATDSAIKHDVRYMRKDGWVQPLDCGGSCRSHHSETLTKLAKHGYAERYKFGGKHQKGSCLYRITSRGRDLLAAKYAENRS